MIVLEREDRARARGATIYASIDGYASTCDAYHRVQMAPDGEEIVRAMTLAIERSGKALEQIGYVNFHGTSTLMNDAVEARCVRQVFGAHADRLAGSSVKSMIGHPQGASGAAGVVTVGAGVVPQFPAADDQSSPPGSGHATSTSSPTTVGSRMSKPRSATASASDPRTARWCSGERDADVAGCDVLIVGAGPAGAVAGTILARAGARVCIVDRATFPRDKLCGDTVNPGTVARLQRLAIAHDLRERSLRVGGMLVTGERGVTVEGRYPEGLYGLAHPPARSRLDVVAERDCRWLRIRAGVTVRRAVLDDRGAKRSGCGVVTATPDCEIERTAPVTIAADGRHSHAGVRSRAGTSSGDSPPLGDRRLLRRLRRQGDERPVRLRRDAHQAGTVHRRSRRCLAG